jgi:hypothetical protein
LTLFHRAAFEQKFFRAASPSRPRLARLDDEDDDDLAALGPSVFESPF